MLLMALLRHCGGRVVASGVHSTIAEALTPFAGASAFNLTANVSPGQLSATNLADQVNTAGLSWKGYSEGMSGNCDLTNHNTAGGDYYLADDEPFLDFADDTANASYCQAHNQPLTQLATDLRSASTTPNFVWFAANDYNDMECG